MDVYVVGKGRVRLGKGEFLGQGGQAAVYALGDRAYKVYSDPQKAIPAAKVRELAALSHPAIVRPEQLLLDGRNRPVGYAMRRIEDPVVLCQAFNRAFRDRQGLTPERMLALVRKLQQGVAHVHGRGILIVDLNEMNFVLDRSLRDLYFIDVDNYQTPSFPATALMETVRDRHASGFSHETDWFSFAVVSFQMLVGIHPYRGKHPYLTELDARMQANVSVLNPAVTVPGTVYPFTVIPTSYLEWYHAVFEDGQRLAPPDEVRGTVVLAAAAPVAAAGTLTIQELAAFSAEVLLVVPISSGWAALTTTGLEVEGATHPVPPEAHLGRTPRLDHLLAAWLEGRRMRLYDADTGRFVPDVLEGEALTAYDGRFYLKHDDTLSEVELLELPAGIRAVLKPVASVLESATTLHDGVALQSLLGTWYAVLCPAPGMAHPVPLPELDGYRVVDARHMSGVLMVIGERSGRYDRFVFRFDPGWTTHDCRQERDVTPSGLNFVVLASGVCLHLNESEELEIFSNRKDSTDAKRIVEPALRGARLHKDGTRALIARGERLFAVTMGR